MREVFVELQHEEMPAGMVRPALKALADGVVGLLEGVPHGEVRTYATPRRLAVSVADVAEGRPRVTKQVLGPPASSAYKDGALTKAGEGFARGKGVDPSALVVVDGPKGKVVAAEVTEGGERTEALLGAGLAGVITGIPFKKSMEWGNGGLAFARPLHRVVALVGGAVVDGSVHGIRFGAETVGHRLCPGAFAVTGSADWVAGLRERAVTPDLKQREARIRQLLVEASETLASDPIVDDVLLEEVLHLVEAPTLVIGAFDPELLALPPRLLIKAMKAHQRYFPVFKDGALTHHFVVISNNPFGDRAKVAAGNAAVLRARFHDAKFFFSEDQKKPLQAHGNQLAKMRWIEGLGTMAQKQERVATLAAELAPLFGADADAARRAGALCKSDLATQMVGEFPDLQGHMGRLYALAQGEDPHVAAAIEEHYVYSHAEALQISPAGAAVALADRLDTLVGCFAIGLIPTGSGDPQALRRSMLTVGALLIARKVNANLVDLFERALHQLRQSGALTLSNVVDPTPSLIAFARARFKASMEAIPGDTTPDIVDAVLAVGQDDLYDWHCRLWALHRVHSGSPGRFIVIMNTVKRVLNICAKLATSRQTEPGFQAVVDERDGTAVLFAGDAVVGTYTPVEPAERHLADAIVRVEAEVSNAVTRLDYAAAFASALSLASPVSAFFDAVLVEAPDPAVKAVRVGLLLRVAAIFARLADFSKISTR